MNKISVGVIGAGGNTRNHHIPKLQAINGVEITGVVNRSQESSQAVADEFGIPKIYDDWTQAIDDPDTNAIVIGTWPYLHCRATLAALESGKHVMCEARMARDASEAWQMRDASQMNPDLIAQIVPSPFSLNVDRTIQKLIADGYLGDILAYELRVGGSFSDQGGELHWRQNFDLSGYNIMALGIWYEAALRWIGEAKSVTAAGKVYTTMRKDPDGIMRSCRIPEHVDVLADMACGAQAHFQISSVAGLCHDNAAYLFGSEGTIRYDASSSSLSGGKRGDTELSPIDILPELFGGWRVEEEFVSAIRGQEAITHTTFEDGVKYMEFTEAVARSMQTGEAVALPL